MVNEEDMFEVNESNLFGGLETVQDVDTSVNNIITNNLPDITSPEWNDHVMSLFEENELIDGNPLSAGLRRVAELVLGPIVDTGPIQVFPPKDDDSHGRATVMWRVEFANGTRFADVADCWEGNTDDKFCVYAVATAATRAEARALRKALRIKRVSADEITSKDTASIVKEKSSAKNTTEGEYEDKDRITGPQLNLLDIKFKQLNVNGEKFFKELWSISTKRKITKKEGTTAITRLNNFQNNAEPIPDSMIGYNSEWRNQ